jgi:hypothetical protein
MSILETCAVILLSINRFALKTACRLRDEALPAQGAEQSII